MARKQYRENPPEAQPKTFRGKWENFWYYHKWHVIIGTVCALVALYLVVQTVSQTEPDLQISVVSDKTVLASDGANAMEQDLLPYTADVNGRGKEVLVQALGFDDPSTEQALRMKFATELQDGYAIYILDAANYKALQNDGIFRKVSEVAPQTRTTDGGMAVPIEDTVLYGKSYGKNLAGMVVVLRAYTGTFKNLMTQAEYDNAVHAFCAILSPASGSARTSG